MKKEEAYEEQEFWAIPWDFRNKPIIYDRHCGDYELKEEDLYDDIGDCVHVRHPVDNEEWRFYYEVVDNRKVIDKTGVIQM